VTLHPLLTTIAEYEELDSDENDQNTNNEMIKEMKALMIEFSSFFTFLEKNDAEAFIIVFESMKNPESMIIDLTNRSFSHYLTAFHTGINDQITDHLQVSLKNRSCITALHIITVHTDMKNTNPDLFAYVMISDHYTFEKFYEVIIDSDESTQSTAEYEQYLAFNKINPTVDLNFF
jgi:hypothetical protein